MRPIIIATRGSALALAQANAVLAECRRAFPELSFELKLIKTTGDKLQTISLTKEGESLPKGLFTKELEVALLNQQADLAVHSLKDLPTELPSGLKLGAVSQRADVRDVLVYRAEGTTMRGFKSGLTAKDLPMGATVGTGSTRRKEQLLAINPGLKIVEHRGNVLTRIEKLAGRADLDAIVLAAAGLDRLGFRIAADGQLTGEGIPHGILATVLTLEEMLPCVGQGAIGVEIREHDERIAAVCAKLNHINTWHCVVAERSFLAAMGGGCLSPVAAYAEILDSQISLRAVSFREGTVRRGEGKKTIEQAKELGEEVAEKLK